MAPAPATPSLLAPSQIAPSLLAADFAHLADEARAATEAGAEWLHLDVMDGHFVPNISFGPGLIRAIRPHSPLPFDVHLMIAPADPYLAAFAQAGASHISVHAEAGPHLHRSLQTIQALGCVPGVALNPATPLDHALSVIDLVGIILVMTVNPGFGGQTFLDSQLPRIAQLRAAIHQSGRPIRLVADGGITPATARLAREAGADMLVAGTAFFGDPDRMRAMQALRA